MWQSLFSDDFPRSRWVSGLLLALFLSLLCAPFLFKGVSALNVAVTILIFALLTASYDLLLGYAAMFSFAHAGFFAIGAYGVGIALRAWDGGWGALLGGLLAGMFLVALVAAALALVSVRIRSLYFALVTLVFAGTLYSLSLAMYDLTGGGDGLIFRIPSVLKPAFTFMDGRIPSLDVTHLFSDRDVLTSIRPSGRLLLYFGIFALSVTAFLGLLRVANSPFGRVLEGLRENEFRARAIGLPVLRYKVLVSVLSAVTAAFAGGLYAVWFGYLSPSLAGFSMMMSVLIMLMIGGKGTLYGAWFGATVLVLAQSQMQDLMARLSETGIDIPILTQLLHPTREAFWMALIYVLIVVFFGRGIVGTLRRRMPVSTASPVRESASV